MPLEMFKSLDFLLMFYDLSLLTPLKMQRCGYLPRIAAFFTGFLLLYWAFLRLLKSFCH